MQGERSESLLIPRRNGVEWWWQGEWSESLLIPRRIGVGWREAYWVLFRFLYGGQFADPSLIIHIDDVGWSAVSECFV